MHLVNLCINFSQKLQIRGSSDLVILVNILGPILTLQLKMALYYEVAWVTNLQFLTKIYAQIY